MDEPTYGDLIKILEEAEWQSSFPHIPISWPSWFLDTIRRIAAPTRPSAIGKAKLDGSPLRTYLKRHGAPRIRNTPGIVSYC